MLCNSNLSKKLWSIRKSLQTGVIVEGNNLENWECFQEEVKGTLYQNTLL